MALDCLNLVYEGVLTRAIVEMPDPKEYTTYEYSFYYALILEFSICTYAFPAHSLNHVSSPHLTVSPPSITVVHRRSPSHNRTSLSVTVSPPYLTISPPHLTIDHRLTSSALVSCLPPLNL
ncbi:hypothetical protein RIF29_10389 [Crotalaria pallida]|uniref:Uncharacterized protein n=1 Tax=Crotalaria pallida TaxID=3830 RepID=A0AAN9FYY8_CROPI